MMLEDLYRLLRSGHVQAQGVVDTMTQPIVVLDQRFYVTTANNAFVKTFQVERDDLLGKSLFDLGDGQWDIPELRDLMADIIPRATAVIGFEVTSGNAPSWSTPGALSTRMIIAPISWCCSTTSLSASDTTRRWILSCPRPVTG